MNEPKPTKTVDQGLGMSGLPSLSQRERIGQAFTELDTPCLVVGQVQLQSNIEALQAFVSAHGLKLRPHAKSHKCPELAKRQISAGAVGICCQKVSEAEAFAASGIGEILIANEVVGAAKLARLVQLHKRCESLEGQLIVCVDSLKAAEEMNQALEQAATSSDLPPLSIYLEINVGQNRCGIEAGEPAAKLAQRIAATMPRLRLVGLQAYHGTAQHLRSIQERKAVVNQVCEKVNQTLLAFDSLGMGRPEVISGGGSGSVGLDARTNVFTEVQAGSYVFMDIDYMRNEWDASIQPALKQSLFILTSVMSQPTSHRAVVDAGLKALSVDSGLPELQNAPGMVYAKANDEHGLIELKAAADGGLPEPEALLGQKLWLIPGHCDPTVNLYDELVVIDDDQVVDTWPILARGRLF